MTDFDIDSDIDDATNLVDVTRDTLVGGSEYDDWAAMERAFPNAGQVYSLTELSSTVVYVPLPYLHASDYDIEELEQLVWEQTAVTVETNIEIP